MARLRAAEKDARSLSHLRICAIGPRTAEELQKRGLVPDVVPAEYQAEGILDVFKSHDLRGTKVLIPRAETAREILPERLREMGARVDVVPVYRTIAPAVELDHLKREMEEGRIDVVTFTSSSTVRNFVELLGGADAARHVMAHAVVGCIGPITAGTAEEYGLPVTIVPKENTVPALAEAIVRHFSEASRLEVSASR
jgi:uroporphyrinogen III methyltransferase/synthase